MHESMSIKLLDINLYIVGSFLIFEFTKHEENGNIKTNAINP